MVRTYDYLSQIDPVVFAERHLQLALDPWQAEAVSPLHQRGVLNCCRQSGKTTSLSVRAVHHGLFSEKAEILIVSASEVQAGQVLERIEDFFHQLGEETIKLKGRSYDLQLKSTGAKIRVLPCKEGAMRGYTATLVIIDEAALIPDAVYYALTGTLASTWKTASIWICSTPRQRSGFFYHACANPKPGWHYLTVTAAECPRISQDYLDEQRRTQPENTYAQDFECRFGDSHDAAFRETDTALALADKNITIISPHTVIPLGRYPSPTYYLILDLAQSRDYSSFTAIEHRGQYLGQNPVTCADLFHGHLLVRWLQRLPLGLDYTDLLRHLRQMLSYPELQAAKNIEIVFDKTGGGAIFHDFLKSAQLGPRITPITITTGSEIHDSNGSWHVPKHELIKTLQFGFRHRLIKIAPGCPDLRVLLEEMQDFRRIITPSGHETYGGRYNRPDDVVMGLSLGVWRAFHQHKASLLRDPNV